MAKKLILGSMMVGLSKFGHPKFFSYVLPLLDVRYCCKLSPYLISRKTYDPNSKNGEKPQFGLDLGLLGPNSGAKFFFNKTSS